ncbi:MAG TPA: MBL fold metallo-hydrolase [Terriglobales bacterium]|nr:MBL fold metallo-hydrolase [Terriglobales bacterium]
MSRITEAMPEAIFDVRILVAGLPLQSCSVMLTDRDGRHIVVDTGFPQHDSLLLDGLQRAGVKAEEVAGVINTHYHLDHFGSNFLFPNAWVYGSKIDFDWAVRIYESVSGGETRREVFRTFYPEAKDEEFDRMDEARVLQLLKWMWDPATLGSMDRYRWCESEDLAIPGLRVVPTPGHTPGHLSIEVAGAEGPYLIVGDARPFADDGAVGYDMPPHSHAEFERSRRLIDQFEGILIPGHDDPFSQTREEAPLATRK